MTTTDNTLRFYDWANASTFEHRRYCPECLLPHPHHHAKCAAHPEVTQPIKIIQAEARVRSYLDQTRLDGMTITGVMRAVGEGPKSHVKRRSPRHRAPMGFIITLWLGLALIGMSMLGLAVLHA